MNLEEAHELADQLLGKFDSMSFVGPGWSGDARRGFMFNREIVGNSIGGQNPGGGGGPPPHTGACCYDDGSCSVVTPVYCNLSHGHYQGDDTVCTDIDCTNGGCGTTGACCNGTDCSILCPADCAAGGGTYQGDGTVCDPNPCISTLGACCIGGVCSQTTPDGCAGTFQGIGVPCTPDPCTTCLGCAFFNPDDGIWYKTRSFVSHAEYHKVDTGLTIDAISDTVKIETCTADGIDCSASYGSGTFDYDAPDIGYHCHCDDTYFCDDPIEAFGFYGLGGLTFTYVCSSVPVNDPACGSGVILSCDFGNCTQTSHYEYSNPCVPP